MAKKKKTATRMGRPPKGILSDFDKLLRQRIKKLRKTGGKWGAAKLLTELPDRYGYDEDELPSLSSINRFLRQEGFFEKRSSKSELSMAEEKEVRALHDMWEMDAQGTVKTLRLSIETAPGTNEMDAQGTVKTPAGHFISPINIKDYRSSAHCICFPVPVKSSRGKPKCEDYLWALRHAFEGLGLPKQLQTDKDSVFLDTRSASPFPQRFHLYLIGLGVDLIFIKYAPPRRQARVERSHQTMDNWVFQQKELSTFGQYWKECRRTVRQYNETFKSPSLQGKTRIETYPDLYENSRKYLVEKEYEIWSMKRVKKYLSKQTFFRFVAANSTFSLGGKVYSLRGAVTGREVRIKYNRKKHIFVVRDPKGDMKWQITPKGLDAQSIIGHSQENLNKIKRKFSSSKDYPLSTT